MLPEVTLPDEGRISRRIQGNVSGRRPAASDADGDGWRPVGMCRAGQGHAHGHQHQRRYEMCSPHQSSPPITTQNTSADREYRRSGCNPGRN